MKYERWIVLPDTQLPYEDYKTLAAVEAYMKDVQVSDNPFVGWLQLGDFLDFNELSRWNEGYEASIKEEVYDTFQAGNRFLDRHQAIMMLSGRPYEMVLLEGNHDYRAYDYGQKYPFLRGVLNYEKNLRLKERGIKWVKTWSDQHKPFKKGNAYFVHGKYTNQYHAKKMVDTYGVCIYYGHLHDVMEIPKVTWGNDKTIVGKSLGCLCDYQQVYLKGSPTNWQQAISEFYFFPDGFFQEVTIKIFKHRFIGLNGVVYDGTELYKR